MVEEEPVQEDGRTWRVVRLDDNGNLFEVAQCATRDEAQRLADRLAAGGHKQTYWVERCAGTVGGDEDRSGAWGEPGERQAEACGMRIQKRGERR